MDGREPVGAAGMTVKRGPKWPWFSALRGPESGPAGKMKQIEAPNRGQNPKEYPRNLGNPPLPRARVRARFTRFIGEKLAARLDGARRLGDPGLPAGRRARQDQHCALCTARPSRRLSRVFEAGAGTLVQQ